MSTSISPSCLDRFRPENHEYSLSCEVDIKFNCSNCTAPLSCNPLQDYCPNSLTFSPTSAPSSSPTAHPTPAAIPTPHCNATLFLTKSCKISFEPVLLIAAAIFVVGIFAASIWFFCCGSEACFLTSPHYTLLQNVDQFIEEPVWDLDALGMLLFVF
jgi:hypothetical protein